MNRYTVTWVPETQADLAQIWVDADDKSSVTNAANAIDVELAQDAENKGSPLSEGLRTIHIPPLHALFSVSEPDRIVEVASVRMDPGLSLNLEGNGQK
jgi:hypothetical protein